MRLVIWFVRLCIGLGSFGVASLAIMAVLGRVEPLFDLINHFQVLICAGLVIALVSSTLAFARRPLLWPLLGVVGLGIAASAFTVVPETMLAMAPRPPLPTNGRQVIKMMTQNIFGMNYDMKRLAAYIDAEKPDIVALQEYFPFQFNRLDPLLKPDYPYSIHCAGGKRANIGLYSRLPFTESGDDDCPVHPTDTQRTAHILAEFTLRDGAKFSVMTTHLDWPVQISASAPLARQADQFAALAKAVRAVSGPLVLVGDMNSTPWSYAQRDFASSAGLTRQSHNLLTYPMRFSIKGWRNTLPFLPLDQVMTKGDIAVHSLRTGAQTGSDHLPLLFMFSLPPAHAGGDLVNAANSAAFKLPSVSAAVN